MMMKENQSLGYRLDEQESEFITQCLKVTRKLHISSDYTSQDSLRRLLGAF